MRLYPEYSVETLELMYASAVATLTMLALLGVDSPDQMDTQLEAWLREALPLAEQMLAERRAAMVESGRPC